MTTSRKFAAALVLVLLALVSQPAAAQFSDSFNFLKHVRDRNVLEAKKLMDKPGSIIVNTRDRDSGDMALHIVTRARDIPWVNFLVQEGADVNARDGQGNTALGIAASMGASDVVRALLRYRPTVDLANTLGETPLIRAVQSRDAATVEALLTAGANPDQPDNAAGLSARQYAARDTRGQVARLLEEAPKRQPRGSIGPRL